MLFVGGVVGGASAAARIRRLSEHAQINRIAVGLAFDRLMFGWRPAEDGAGVQPLLPDQAIDSHYRVGDVLDRYPQLLATFLAFGFKPPASPWLRTALAHRVTIAQACRLVGVDTDALLTRLNQERTETATARISLHVVS